MLGKQQKTKQATNHHQEKELKHKITRQLFQLKCIITTFVDCCFTVKSLSHFRFLRVASLFRPFFVTLSSSLYIHLSLCSFPVSSSLFLYVCNFSVVCICMSRCLQFTASFNFMSRIQRALGNFDSIKLCIEE